MMRTSPILWDIYEEHLAEAAFLWGQWEQALLASNYTLDEVAAGPEERLLAHLDGLVLGAQPVAERLLVPALSGDDPGASFAAAWSLLQAEHADHFDEVAQALFGAEEPPKRAALARAFELCPRPDLPERLLPRLTSSPPALQACLVDAISARGAQATERLPLQTMSTSPDPATLAAVLRALQRKPDPAMSALVSASLGCLDVAQRDAAIEAAVQLQLPGVREQCRRLLELETPSPRLPLAYLALHGEARDQSDLLARLTDARLAPDVVWALGFSGSLPASERLLALLDDEKLAPLAAEAFATISGLPIDGAMRKPGQAASLFDPFDPDAPVPEVKPEDDLPLPNPAPIREWWQSHKSTLDPNLRYVLGRPVDPEATALALWTGPMWRRRVFRLGLGGEIMTRLDLRQWARTQRRNA